MKHRFEIILQIVEIKRQLTSTKFIKSGYIYFKGDILENMSINSIIVLSVLLHSLVLERFTLGPLTLSGLWRGDRASIDINRGPCKFIFSRR